MVHAGPGPAPGTEDGATDQEAHEGLRRLLSILPDERAPRRIVGVVADAVRAASCALLLVEGEGGLALVAGVGLDDAGPAPGDGLAAEALAAGGVRLAADPGAPFPAGTRLAAAAPFSPGGARGALLVATREERLDDDALLLLRAAADRAGLLLERERLLATARLAAEQARQADEEAERRRRAVDTILGVIGHDLRNPLGAVHLSAALLQKRGALQGWQARAVERVRSSAGRMGRMIADLHGYARTSLGSGIAVRRTGADLRAVVGRVVEEFRASNPDREIVVAEDGADLYGAWDPERLEQVAANLVSTAADHGDPEAPVRVELSGTADEVALTVRSAGAGLPPELLAPLDPSPGEGGRRRDTSGLGLGLYVCREIVRCHGGEIAARTEPGEIGFAVRLPRRGPGAA